MSAFLSFIIAAVVSFVLFLLLEPIVRGILRFFGVYDRCRRRHGACVCAVRPCRGHR